MKTYEIFMTHAKKLTNSKVAKDHHSTALQGVKHFEDGRLAVTDSHRLYIFKTNHGKGDKLITPEGREIKEGNYPEVSRLIPASDPKQEIYHDVKDLMVGADCITALAKAEGLIPEMSYENNTLSFRSPESSFTHELQKAYEDGELLSNASYWLEALKLFWALDYDKVCLKTYGNVRPFILESLDRKLLVVIMPIRRR